MNINVKCILLLLFAMKIGNLKSNFFTSETSNIVDCNEPPKQLEIPTLGHQPVVLGGFFSAVEDEFVPGLALFSREDIEAHKITIDHPKQETKWTSGQTIDEKLEMMRIDVSGSISVDLETTKLSAKGSFSYLDEEKVQYY